jgi:hypothetical protein
LRPRPSLNSVLGLKSGFLGAVAVESLPDKVYEDEEVAGKEPQPKVNYMCLIITRQALREASLERSHSTTHQWKRYA